MIVGERIGTGIRRLTRTARDIAAGDLSVRAAMSSKDEVGVLGETFDSMASSIETLASELRQSAEEEAEVRNRLEAVVAGMGEALLAVDSDGRIATFNGAAEELFGIPARQALGGRVGDVATITAEDGADLTARLTGPPEAGWSQSAIVVRPDGLLVPVALSAGGLRGSGDDVIGGVYVLRDMRREREAERAKSELLSNISHELRTPLVPIKGYAELLLRRDVPPDKARESLEEIVEAADRLEAVVQRLLDVAAQEAAPSAMRHDRVQVGPMIESVVESVADPGRRPPPDHQPRRPQHPRPAGRPRPARALPRRAGRQRGQVLARRRAGQRHRPPHRRQRQRRRRARRSTSRCATTASASLPTAWRGSSRTSPRATAPRPACSVASGWAWPSCAASSRPTTAS